ncbi:MAG: hypothetical protein ABIQ16_28475 [Polyangiaceae bacterium]
MNKRMPGLGAVLLLVGLAIAACSSSAPSGDTSGPKSGAGGTTSGGAGAAHAGRGGSNARAGSTSKAGASGEAGGGGDAGDDTMPEGGAGGAPDASQCPLCASGFCFTDGTCVDCLPSADNCPSGKVCGSTNKCVPGCKADGTSCASGVCADATNCQSCIGDKECGDAKVCGDNTCAAACTVAQEGTSQGCSTGHTCCSQHCIDADTDSEHCGACGAACAKGQFCGPGACSDAGEAGAGGASGTCVSCHDTVLANVCSVPQIAVVLDGQDGNETTGRALAAALVAHCEPAPLVREVKQTVPDALNPASGRPVSGAHELLVSAGGSYFARLLVYLDSQRVSPIYSYDDGESTIGFREASNDHTVVSRQKDEPNEDHDFFVIQIARDATTGSLVLNAQGFWVSGTIAATYFFSHGMLPTLETFDKAWYVYEWKDKNGDHAPDLNEITAVAAGN